MSKLSRVTYHFSIYITDEQQMGGRNSFASVICRIFFQTHRMDKHKYILTLQMNTVAIRNSTLDHSLYVQQMLMKFNGQEMNHFHIAHPTSCEWFVD